MVDQLVAMGQARRFCGARADYRSAQDLLAIPLSSLRFSVSRRRRNRWWKCLSLLPPSATGSAGRRPTGALVIRGLVASYGASPPAQGGISILGQDLVDAPGTVQPLFQFIDRVVEIRGCGCPDSYAQCKLCSSGECGVNCSDKFQQFLIACERPCDPAAKTFLGARCSVRQWIHILRQQGRLLEEFLGFLREWVHSAPKVKSRPAPLSSGVEVATLVVDHGSSLIYTGFAAIDAPRAVFPTIAFTQNGAVCTEHASGRLFFLENLDIISTNPLFCSIFSCAQSPLVIFWEPSTTKSSSLSRARGWRGRQESDSQVTCHQLVSSDSLQR